MSRIYIHSRKYRKRNTKIIAALSLCLLLVAAIAGQKIYNQYIQLSNTPQTSLNNSSTTVTGYINPYFLFKDTGKWARDSTNSTVNKLIYYQYQNGVVAKQLSVYINKQPTPIELAANRVLPVRVVNGDTLMAGSVSGSCSALQPSGTTGVKEVTFNGIMMLCDPNNKNFSIILGQTGGDYKLTMTKSKLSQTFIVVYQDYSKSPDANDIVNIANSFKVI